MADYKRIVSYMYDYEEGTKKNNVGFARVEARNGQCKIMINIKAPSLNNHTLKTYIYNRNDDKMIPIQVGDIFIRNGIGDFRTITRADNIMNSSTSLDQMCGIIVYFNHDKFFATEWDDKPIILHNFNDEEVMTENHDEGNTKPDTKHEFIEEDKILEKIIDHEEKKNDSEKVLGHDEENIIFEKFEHEQEQEEQCMEDDSDQESVMREDLSSHNEKMDEKPYEKPYEKSYEKSYEYNNTAILKDYPCSPIASRIFARYTKMFPFNDDEIAECVRIEPQDIGAFPMEHWVLGNNSFLLHGYYNYRHLIFARRKCEDGNQYIIGVPGFFQNREKFMAKLFGFEDFKPISQNDQMNGEFGYWYTIINI